MTEVNPQLAFTKSRKGGETVVIKQGQRPFFCGETTWKIAVREQTYNRWLNNFGVKTFLLERRSRCGIRALRMMQWQAKR